MPGDFFVTLHDESVSPGKPNLLSTAHGPRASTNSNFPSHNLGHSPWGDESKKAFFPFRLSLETPRTHPQLRKTHRPRYFGTLLET